MLKMTVRNKSTGLAAKLRKQFEAAEADALSSVIPDIRHILLITVGTQYYSQATLTAMKHPYSIHRPHPPLPPGVINRQTNRFYSSFVMTNPVKIGSKVVISIYSSDQQRHEQLMASPHMIERNYVILLRSRINAMLRKRLPKELASHIKAKVR